MKSEDEVRPVGEHQALHGDYKDTLYTKGHVYPYDHAYDQEQADSTFTHTNVAPQRLADNNIDWTQAEKAIKEDMDGKCNLDSTYVVTGVIPGSKTIDKENDEGEIIKQINVPSHYWTAYCCKDRNDPNRFTSEAYIMEMRYRTEEEAKKDPIKPTSTTVTVLNDSIKKLYNDKLEEGHKITDFRLFGTLENCH